VIKKILYGNVSMIDARHQDGIEFFGNWAKIAPAFGMIGTLLGLIGMMANLEDTASIGPNMAVALITTLYGSIVANLVLMPIQIKLVDRNKEELLVKEIMLQGIYPSNREITPVFWKTNCIPICLLLNVPRRMAEGNRETSHGR
jgi:chemotaxis protein MotA